MPLPSRAITLLATALAFGGASAPAPAQRAGERASVARADSLPVYPEVLRATDAGRSTVDLAVAVDPSGRVVPGGVRPVAAENDLFAYAARAAVRRWTFRPARRGGRAIADTIRVQIEFALDSTPPCPARPPDCAAPITPSDQPARRRATLDTAAARVRVVACRYWTRCTRLSRGSRPAPAMSNEALQLSGTRGCSATPLGISSPRHLRTRTTRS